LNAIGISWLLNCSAATTQFTKDSGVKSRQRASENFCQWGTREKSFHQKSFFLESMMVSSDTHDSKTLGHAKLLRSAGSLEDKQSE
jgi:hypothetical protein